MIRNWAQSLFLPPESLHPKQWQLLWILGATMIVHQYDTGIVGIALPNIQASLNIPESELGNLIGYSRLGGIPAIILALFADRLGRQKVLIATILGFMFFSFVTAFTRTQTEFILAQFFAKFFLAAEAMLAIVVLVETIPASSRGWAIGIFAALGSLGHGLSSFAYIFIDQLPYGWRSLYALSVLPLLFLATIRRKLPESERFIEFKKTSTNHPFLSQFLIPLKQLLKQHPRRFATIATMVFSYWFTATTALGFMSKYLQDERNFAATDVSILFICGGVLAVIGNISVGRMSDRFGRRPVLFITLMSIAGSILFFYNSHGPLMVIAWVTMMFFLFGAEVILSALASELFPTSYRSTASKASGVIGILGGSLGFAVEGLLYQSFGNHSAAISTMVLGFLLAPWLTLRSLPETANLELEEITQEKT